MSRVLRWSCVLYVVSSMYVCQMYIQNVVLALELELVCMVVMWTVVGPVTVGEISVKLHWFTQISA
jgi:hypothetical protein